MKHSPMVETLIDALGMLSWSPRWERSLSSYLQSYREWYNVRKMTKYGWKQGKKGWHLSKMTSWLIHENLRSCLREHLPYITLEENLTLNWANVLFQINPFPSFKAWLYTKLSMGGDWDWGNDHDRRIPSELLLIERFVGGTSLTTTGSASVK